MQDCILVDIDGTLANVEHRLHHIKDGNHDWDSFFDAMDQDTPTEMLKLLSTFPSLHSVAFVYVSGRPDSHRDMTIAWLNKYNAPIGRLYMRKTGDHRQDTVVKQEMLEQIKGGGFNPILVIDDRPSVIKMWRDNNLDVIEFNVDRWSEGPEPSVKPRLMMLIGPSCGGKSTWAEWAYEKDEIISTDRLRETFCGDFKDQSRNSEVFHAYHRLIETRMKLGLLTVADATNIRARDRRAVRNVCPKNATITYIIIDRPMVDKVQDAGWRRGVMLKGGVWLLDAHQQTFNSNLKDILNGDGDSRVVIVDRRGVGAG